MTVRNCFYAESLGITSYTGAGSSSYVTNTTLTFTPDANATYYFLTTGEMSLNSTTAAHYIFCNLFDNTNSVTMCEVQQAVLTTTEYRPLLGLAKFTAGASPASSDFYQQVKLANTADTGKVQSMRIVAFKDCGNDAYTENNANQTTTSTSFTTALTLSFTPATAGDYLIIGYAELSNPTDAGAECKMNTNSTDYCDEAIPTGGGFTAYGGMFLRTNISGAQSITLQFKSLIAGHTTTIRKARLLAIRLDDFASYNTNDQRTRQTTSSASFVDASSYSPTLNNGDYLVLASNIFDGSVTNDDLFSKIVVDGSDQITWQCRAASATTIKHNPAFFGKKHTMTSGSRTLKVQHHPNTGTTTMGSNEMVLAALELPSTKSGTGSSANIVFSNDTSTGNFIASGNGSSANIIFGGSGSGGFIQTGTGTSAIVFSNDTSSGVLIASGVATTTITFSNDTSTGNEVFGSPIGSSVNIVFSNDSSSGTVIVAPISGSSSVNITCTGTGNIVAGASGTSSIQFSLIASAQQSPPFNIDTAFEAYNREFYPDITYQYQFNIYDSNKLGAYCFQQKLMNKEGGN